MAMAKFLIKNWKNSFNIQSLSNIKITWSQQTAVGFLRETTDFWLLLQNVKQVLTSSSWDQTFSHVLKSGLFFFFTTLLLYCSNISVHLSPEAQETDGFCSSQRLRQLISLISTHHQSEWELIIPISSLWIFDFALRTCLLNPANFPAYFESTAVNVALLCPCLTCCCSVVDRCLPPPAGQWTDTQWAADSSGPELHPQ